MIDIRHTDTEYLLFLPKEQNARARKIGGRQFDYSRGCWVYPKTRETHAALLREFRSDLLSQRNLPEKDKKQQARESSQALNEGLAKLQEKYDSLKQLQNVEIQKLQQELKSREDELEDLQKKLDKLKRENKKLTKAHHGLAEAQEAQKNENQALLKELDEIRSSSEEATLEEAVLNLVIQANGENSKFADMVRKIDATSDEAFHIRLHVNLENELRRMLPFCKPRNDSKRLFNFIKEAERSDLLKNGEVTLAHVIRTQRNVVAHENASTDRQISTIRMLLSLLAAALLWKQFNFSSGD